MASKVFNALGQQQNNVMQQFSIFQQNPMQFLLNRKINIPQNLQNDPHQAVQYLLNSGQMTQEQFNKLNTLASQMGVKLT